MVGRHVLDDFFQPQQRVALIVLIGSFIGHQLIEIENRHEVVPVGGAQFLPRFGQDPVGRHFLAG